MGDLQIGQRSPNDAGAWRSGDRERTEAAPRSRWIIACSFGPSTNVRLRPLANAIASVVNVRKVRTNPLAPFAAMDAQELTHDVDTDLQRSPLFALEAKGFASALLHKAGDGS